MNAGDVFIITQEYTLVLLFLLMALGYAANVRIVRLPTYSSELDACEHVLPQSAMFVQTSLTTLFDPDNERIGYCFTRDDVILL